LIASVQSKTAGISITIMPAAGWRAYTRRHAANSQLDKPAQRYCSFQTARGLPSVLILVAPGHQAPYQPERRRHARDIRGRVGLALDCRSGPGPRTVDCRARSSSDQGAARLKPLIWIKAVGIEDGNCEKMTTLMIIVYCQSCWRMHGRGRCPAVRLPVFVRFRMMPINHLDHQQRAINHASTLRMVSFCWRANLRNAS
jgi:hypothetical protein